MSARRPRGRRSESEAPHWRPRELPFYAADDTRLHWAILAGCMVSKRLIKAAAWGLTGVFRPSGRQAVVMPGLSCRRRGWPDEPGHDLWKRLGPKSADGASSPYFAFSIRVT